MNAPDLAPKGAIWVCLACGERAKNRIDLLKSGYCRLNVALCVDDGTDRVSLYDWRLYEPRR